MLQSYFPHCYSPQKMEMLNPMTPIVSVHNPPKIPSISSNVLIPPNRNGVNRQSILWDNRCLYSACSDKLPLILFQVALLNGWILVLFHQNNILNPSTLLFIFRMRLAGTTCLLATFHFSGSLTLIFIPAHIPQLWGLI